jgi:hypothetical protein
LDSKSTGTPPEQQKFHKKIRKDGYFEMNSKILPNAIRWAGSLAIAQQGPEIEQLLHKDRSGLIIVIYTSMAEYIAEDEIGGRRALSCVGKFGRLKKPPTKWPVDLYEQILLKVKHATHYPNLSPELDTPVAFQTMERTITVMAMSGTGDNGPITNRIAFEVLVRVCAFCKKLSGKCDESESSTRISAVARNLAHSYIKGLRLLPERFDD